MRNRWLALAASAATLSGVLVALGTPVPALAGSGTLQNGPFAAGNLLSYANSDFEGHANFIPVTNIGNISYSSAAALHGSQSLEFTSPTDGTTALELQVGSSPTRIDLNPSNQGATYTLGGWFKLPAANSNENVTFSLDLYDLNGTSFGTFSTPALQLNQTSIWQYVQGQITVPPGTGWALDSPEVTLSNAVANQVTYMDMLVFKPYRGAQAIGARGPLCVNVCNSYKPSDWMYADSAIGPLQSDKEFFDPSNSNGYLPSTFQDTTCYGIEQKLGSTNYSAWPVCIIAYIGPATQASMNSFLSDVPPQQELYLVWRQEPELSTSEILHPDCPNPNLTRAQAFVCEFEYQANLIHSSTGFGPNIFVAMNSAGSAYGAGNDIGCSFIPPSNDAPSDGADIYLLDFYETADVPGTNVNTEPDRAQNWKNWLSCATAYNRPIGFGEYGLDESTTPVTFPTPCTNNTSDAAEAPNAMTADNSYLEQLPMSGQAEMQHPVPVVVWNYWWDSDSGTCSQFDNSFGAINTWQDIEAANGGG